MDMLIPELFTSTIAVQPQTAGSALRAWTAGQILEATVVRQALDGTVTLRVGNQELQARTGLNLAADQALTLQVAQSGTQTVLRVLHVSNTGATPHPTTLPQTSAPTPEATLAQAWRHVLPREGNLRPLLAQLAGTTAAAATALDAGGELQPGPVAAALKQFAARLPMLESLTTPAGLKRAVSDSGIFLEAHLAQALTEGKAPAVQNDIKANLLQLVVQLRSLAATATPTTPATATAATAATPATAATAQKTSEQAATVPAAATPTVSPQTTSTPSNSAMTNSRLIAELPTDPALPAVLRQADAALARIEQNQLTTLSGGPQATMLLAVDLPVRDTQYTGVLELNIEEQETGAPAGATVMPWSVWLHFDFEHLGKVHARISLRGEEVATTLWAEHAPTAALFQQHLVTLDDALRNAGLVPTTLHCQTGIPPRNNPPPAPSSLLDERA